MFTSLLRKPEDSAKPVPGVAFVKKRRVWDEWIGAASRREKIAYAFAFGALGVAGLAVRDAREQHKKGAYIPYVVERDATGRRVASGVLDGPRTLTDEQIRKRLLVWLRDTRMIVADYAGLRELVSDAYDMTAPGSIARQKLIAHHQADPPEARAARYTVHLSDQSALRVANRTWQLEWREHTVGRDGMAQGNDLWRMTITYEITAPSDPAEIERNPEGFFVIDFDWRKPQQSIAGAVSPAGGRQ